MKTGASRVRPLYFRLDDPADWSPSLSFSAVLERDERGVVPGQLGDRLGQFLEPADVVEPAVPDGRVGPEDDLESRPASRAGLAPNEATGLAVTDFGWLAVSAILPSCRAFRQVASKSAGLPLLALPVVLDDVQGRRSKWPSMAERISWADLPP